MAVASGSLLLAGPAVAEEEVTTDGSVMVAEDQIVDDDKIKLPKDKKTGLKKPKRRS
jgi:hypothetical protein